MSKTLVLVIVILLWIALIVLTVKGGPYSMAVLGCIFFIFLVLRIHERGLDKESRQEFWNRVAKGEDIGRNGHEVIMIKEDDGRVTLIGWYRGKLYEERADLQELQKTRPQVGHLKVLQYVKRDPVWYMARLIEWDEGKGLFVFLTGESGTRRFPVTDKVADELGIDLVFEARIVETSRSQDKGDRELDGGI